MSSFFISKLDPTRVRGPVVKISSPEQYVPLFLINEFEHPDFIDTAVSTYYASFIKGGSTVFPFNGGHNILTEQNSSDFKALVRQALINWLDTDLPQEYCFSVPYNIMGRYGLGSAFGLNTVSSGGEEDCLHGILRLGAYFSTEVVASTNPGYHISQFVSCALLTLVKAKHINYLRATAFLHEPAQVPFEDFKILRDPDIRMSSYPATGIPELLEYYRKEGVPISTVNQAEMKKYLFGNVNNDHPDLTLSEWRAASLAKYNDFMKRLTPHEAETDLW